MSAVRMLCVCQLFVCLILSTTACHAASAIEKPALTLVVTSDAGFSRVMESIANEYEKLTKVHLTINVIEDGSVASHFSALQPASDIVVARRSTIDTLVAERLVMRDSRKALGKSFIAMAVRNGSFSPKISTVAQLRDSLTQARSIATSDSGSGIYLSHWLFPRLTLNTDSKSRVNVISVKSVSNALVEGKVQIGFDQIGKLKSTPGIRVVGLIPDKIQQMILYCAAISSKTQHLPESKALLGFLLSAKGRTVMADHGLQAPLDARM